MKSKSNIFHYKKISLVLVALFLLTPAGIWANADSEDAVQSEIKEVEGRIETLQGELALLNKKLTSIQAQSQKNQVQPIDTSVKKTSSSLESTKTVPSNDKITAPVQTGTYKYWSPNTTTRTTQTSTVQPTKVVPKEPVTPVEPKTQSSPAPASYANNYNVLQGAESAISASFSVEGYQKVLLNADLGNMIKYDKEGFTVFVPVDTAMMSNLSPDRVVQLLSSKKDAQFFTMFHMLKGQRTLNSLNGLNGTAIDSVNGMTLNFVVSKTGTYDQLLINGAGIVGGPYKGNNVIIYIVDNVITP